MPSLCGGLEGTFLFAHLVSVSSRIHWLAQGEAPACPTPSVPSFKMNLYKAHGIKPNLVINFRFLLESVSLLFLLSVHFAGVEVALEWLEWTQGLSAHCFNFIQGNVTLP